jgi:hypothetical protein
MTTLEELIQPFVSESRPKGTSRQNSTSSLHNLIQDDIRKAQQLINHLVSGPAIASQSIGTLLVPISNLCAASNPSLRSKGYELIALLCKSNPAESTPSNDVQRTSEDDDENEKAEESITNHGGGIELTVMERRRLWDALRSAGESWHPETTITRLDALEALLGIQVGSNIFSISQSLTSQDYETMVNAGIPINGNAQVIASEKSLFPLAEPRANVEGLEELIKEIRSWTSDAIVPLLSPDDDRHTQSAQTLTSSLQSSSTPTLSASQISMGEKGGATKERNDLLTAEKENLIKQREAFVYRLDMIVDRIASDNPNVRTEAEICRTVELYSSWIDRAIRVETRARANAAPHQFSFGQNGSNYHAAVGSGQTRVPRPHGRQNSIITTPTAFTFPSSVVTPAETTVSFFNNTSTSGTTSSNHTHSHATRPAYEIVGPLFLSLLERCIKKTILIPSQTLSRTVSSLCGLLSLVMRPFDSATILDPTPASRSRQGETEASEEHRVSDTVLDVAKKSSMDTRVMKLLDLLFHDKWYAASTLQTIRQLLLPPSSATPQGNNGQATTQPATSSKPGLSTSLNSPTISLGAVRTLRYSIVKALYSELARVQLNDFVASGYTMGGAPSMYIDNQLYDLSWKSGNALSAGVSGLRFEVIGKGLKEAVGTWRQVRSGMVKELSVDGKSTPNVSLVQGIMEEAGDLVLIECCEVVRDVVSLSPKGEVGEVPRFAGQIIEELAGVLSDQK